MADRIVLNTISYHGHGAIENIVPELTARGYKKAFVCSDPDLIKFGVTKKVTDLLDAAAAVELSRASIRNIKENLFWAFFYNSIGIPLAAGVFYPLLGWQLNPMFAAAAMSLSSVCVVSYALRLRFFKSKFKSPPTEERSAREGACRL